MTKNGQTSYKRYMKTAYGKYKKQPTIYEAIGSMLSYLERIAIGRFEWHGIDGTGIANSRKIEEYLFYDKQCAIVDTKEYGLVVTRVLARGVNINAEPAGYDILTGNGSKLTPVNPNTLELSNGKSIKLEGQISDANAIILHDSCLFGRGAIDGVNPWLEKFADAQISIDQQMINQRAPLLGLSRSRNDEQMLTTQMIDYATGLNALIVDAQFADSIKTFNLESPFNIDKINSMQHEYLARALNSMGVDAMQAFGKKERMIVDEVESNDESLAMILADAYHARANPLEDNPIAKQYGISVNIAKPYRISTYKENMVVATPVEVPANEQTTMESGDDAQPYIV